MISTVNIRKAFNIITHDSVIVLQFQQHLYPTACCIELPPVFTTELQDEESTNALANTVKCAYDTIMEDYPPDDSATALVIEDSPNGNMAERAAEVLLKEKYCKKVMIVEDGLGLHRKYGFLQGSDHSFPSSALYPSEITDDLYLGAYGSARDEKALSDLGIAAVVSVIDVDMRKSGLPAIIEPSNHLWCCIEDAVSVNILPVLEAAVPFIISAHHRGLKVLVHCHQGMSRSASVLVAYMLTSGMTASTDEAIAVIREQRSFVRPNPGFMRQLAQFEEQHRNKQLQQQQQLLEQQQQEGRQQQEGQQQSAQHSD